MNYIGGPLLLLIFIFWLKYEISKSDRKSDKADSLFFETESKANSTRKKDISNLDYITIPLDKLPFDENTSNEKIISYQDTIIKLSTQKILNLTGISNTDLKLKYGVANLEFLSECDENFTLLARTIANWGEELINISLENEAISVLEYGISINSDVSKNYILLGLLYSKLNKMQPLNELIKKAESLNSLTKNSVITKLKEIIEQSTN